jgi:hypothetical protein
VHFSPYAGINCTLDGAAGSAIYVEGTTRAVGAGSGAPVQQRIFLVYGIEGERIKRMQIFFDREQARRAAGLAAEG